MRLLEFSSRGELSLTKNLIKDIPTYAILSHTWGADDDEVTFDDLKNGSGKRKAGYTKIRFCGEQARRDGLQYFWVDTCCIDKANYTELSEAIASMFRWYRDAVKCYVYLSDISVHCDDNNQTKRTWKSAFQKSRWLKRGTTLHDDDKQSQQTWESSFQKSRWFTRGWTLQELLAPKSVEFFSREGKHLGNKITLERQIHETTQIPIAALRGTSLSHFSVNERIQWAAKRTTTRKEDSAYCLLGVFDVFIPLIYGEGENSFIRLKEAIDKTSKSE